MQEMYKSEEAKQEKIYGFSEKIQSAEDLEDLLPDFINFI